MGNFYNFFHICSMLIIYIYQVLHTMGNKFLRKGSQQNLPIKVRLDTLNNVINEEKENCIRYELLKNEKENRMNELMKKSLVKDPVEKRKIEYQEDEDRKLT